jgi:hypothetical protein
MSMPRYKQANVPQSYVLAPTLYNFHVNDTPETTGFKLALFADDTCVYTTGRKEGYVVRELKRRLSSMAAWCKRWNLKKCRIDSGNLHHPLNYE